LTALRPLAVVALAALHCGSRGPEPAPRARAIVETARGASHAVAIEVARSDEERARGLMHRRQLAPDAGMLFLFDESSVHHFWMKDTLVPLDMIFIGEDGRIVGIVEWAVPGDLSPRSASGPSRYVLEVNGGWAEAHGVATGDRVRFEGVSRY
jgi:uncharacterized protein